MHVLVVENDAVSRRFVSESLLYLGFRVTTAKDGAEALELFYKNDFSIVVTNRTVPIVDGIELCKEIRRRETSNKYTYLIMIASCNDREEMMSGLRSGADDYITKPFNWTELALRAKVAERIIERDTRAVTLFALSRFIETRSAESRGHLDRVSMFTKLLATALKDTQSARGEIDETYIECVTQASWLHDIGKTAVPDHLLLKSGPLTAAERIEIETHTVVAADALDEVLSEFPSVPLLQYGSEIARSHHEHFDGNGYPNGLRGNEIPLSARIVAVADVYDAIRSRRAYKEPMSHSAAENFLRKRSGTQFDPSVIDAFLTVSPEFQKICDASCDGVQPAFGTPTVGSVSHSGSV